MKRFYKSVNMTAAALSTMLLTASPVWAQTALTAPATAATAATGTITNYQTGLIILIGGAMLLTAIVIRMFSKARMS